MKLNEIKALASKGFGFRQEAATCKARRFEDGAALLGYKDVPGSHIIWNDDIPINDQGLTGSCVGQAIAKAFEVFSGAQTGIIKEYSPHFVYWNSRKLHGDENKDEGTFINVAFESILQYGLAEKQIVSNHVSHINDKPPFSSYHNGFDYRDGAHYRIVTTLGAINAILEGTPVVFGLQIDEQWFEPKTRLINTYDKTKIAGGHAMLISGYRIVGKQVQFLVVNSWGKEWAQNGKIWITDEVYFKSMSRWVFNI